MRGVMDQPGEAMEIEYFPTDTPRRFMPAFLKDGKVFDFLSSTTPAPGARDEGIVKQLFRNLGTKQIFGDG